MTFTKKKYTKKEIKKWQRKKEKRKCLAVVGKVFFLSKADNINKKENKR